MDHMTCSVLQLPRISMLEITCTPPYLGTRKDPQMCSQLNWLWFRCLWESCLFYPKTGYESPSPRLKYLHLTKTHVTFRDPRKWIRRLHYSWLRSIPGQHPLSLSLLEVSLLPLTKRLDAFEMKGRGLFVQNIGSVPPCGLNGMKRVNW